MDYSPLNGSISRSIQILLKCAFEVKRGTKPFIQPCDSGQQKESAEMFAVTETSSVKISWRSIRRGRHFCILFMIAL